MLTAGDDGGMRAQRLAHDTIEVRKRVEVLHGWVVVIHRQELVAQAGLNFRVLGDGVKRPGRCRTVHEIRSAGERMWDEDQSTK